MALKFKIETPEEKRRKILYRKFFVMLAIISVALFLGYNFVFKAVLDTVGPKVLIAKPLSDEIFHSKKIDLSLTVIDESKIEYCKVLLNNEEKKIFNATVNEMQTISLELSDGIYSLVVKCRDNSLLKNAAKSEARSFSVITPLIVEKVIGGVAPDLKEGLLMLRTGATKGDLGNELIDLLPRNAKSTLKNETKPGHLSVSLWGKTHLDKQEIVLEVDSGTKKIYLPELNNITSEMALYIAGDGSTYHSFSSHDYDLLTNGNQKLPDLTVDEALQAKHLARRSSS